MTLTRAMAVLLVLNVFVLSGLLWLASPPGYQEIVLQHTWDTLRGEGSDDSWAGMAVALDYAQSPRASPLYQEVFFKRHIKFQYPPSALLAMAAMRKIDPGRIRLGDSYAGPWPSINGALSKLAIALMALATAALLELSLRQSRAFAECHRLVAVRAILVAALTLTFYPVVKAFTLGNIQVWINSMLALALLGWAAGWKASAGMLTGLILLIKPHYGFLLLWAALRREWRYVLGCAASVGLGLAASLALFGWADHVDYLRAVSYMSRHGEAYYPNQSVNGLLNRLMSVGEPQLYDNLEFHDDGFPPFNRWVHAGTLITSAALLLPAIFWRSGDKDRVLDLCTMLVSCTLASPIAWEHHHGVLLPVFAVALAAEPMRLGGTAWLVLSYVLTSTLFSATRLLAPGVLNIGQSYLFAGALILLALLYARRRAYAAGPDP